MGYYLKLLAPKTMKLLGSTKSKITKDENGENLPKNTRKIKSGRALQGCSQI